MRKIAYILIVLLGMVSSAAWSATKLSPVENHYVALWGQVGYSMLMSNPSTLKPGPGFSPALGVGYRYLHNGFLLQTGIEGQYSYFNTRVKSADYELKMYDTEGEAFVLNAHVKDNKDITQAVHMNIPVLAGYEYGRFYFLAGANFSMCLFSNARAQATLNLTGRYADFIDPFEDMPNHQLQSDLVVKSDTYDLKWRILSVNAHLEIGARVDEFWVDRNEMDPRPKSRVYVAAFADYGLVNVHSGDAVGETLSYHQEHGQPLTFQVVPAMVSQQLQDAKVFPLVVGIKATVLFELPKVPICIICRD